MRKFGRSQPITRTEDLRLLTGQGRYVDDIAPRDALFAAFCRSPVAHARMTAIDTEAARALPGVALVLTLADLEAMGLDCHIPAPVQENRDGTKGADPRRPVLAGEKVRHVGEAIAVVVATTRTTAREGAEMVEVTLDDLPAKVDPVPGGETIHDEAPGNVAFDWMLGDEARVEARLAASAHVIRVPVANNRVIANPLEPRGCFAEPMEGGRLHLCFGGQGVWNMKEALGRFFRTDEAAFRVTNPDVGGGFGMKANSYPEYYAVAAAARHLGRPVRWMSERTEAMLTDNGGRAVDAVCTLGLDADHRITAYKVESFSDLGAYNSEYGQFIQSALWAKVLPGAYDVQDTLFHVRGIYTNTAPVDAYRGAGRPEAIYAIERTIDYAARELGVDAWALRRRNFIAPDQFPYRNSTGELYDVGEFDRVLTRAEVEADRAGFPARRDASRKAGRLRGLGLAFYIESILGSPHEDATVEFTGDGGALLYVGTQSNGQGHETVYARFLADQTGIPMEKIRVIQGDSDRIAKGGGTGGSRSVTNQNNATLATVAELVTRFSGFLAEIAGVGPEMVHFDDERFRVKGSNLTPTMLEAAALARAHGRADLMRTTASATLPGRSYPNGAHVAEVEVDPETGRVEVLRYTVADDFGNLVNPRLVEGQIHGGVAQGVGQALTERTVFDEDGQLLTATFMDYAMPRADLLPMIAFHSVPVPSTANVMGMKGCGEAGSVGATGAVANAVLDALWPAGVRHADIPLTPMRVWSLVNDAANNATANDARDDALGRASR